MLKKQKYRVKWINKVIYIKIELNESEYLEKSSRFNTLTNLTPDLIFNQMNISNSNKLITLPS